MRPIFLQTADCEDVARVYIPAFPDDKLPEVVTWGTRTFAVGRFADGKPGCSIRFPGEEAMPVYRECFAVAALDEPLARPEPAHPAGKEKEKIDGKDSGYGRHVEDQF